MPKMNSLNKRAVFGALKKSGNFNLPGAKKPVGALGVPGVSGHHGVDITRQMIKEVNIIATAPKSRPHIYSPIASRIYAVLSAAEKGELFIERRSVEQTVLVELVNRLLDLERGKKDGVLQGKLKVTPLQAKTLMKYYNMTKRRL
ncbi:MAG: hypothetical protein WCW44_01295 [archaeon]